MDVSKCPVMHGALTSNRTTGTSNQDWWPNQLNLNFAPAWYEIRSHKGDHDYREAFKKLDLKALKKDLTALMTDRRTGAGRLWSLWPVFHPHDMARSRHLPYG